MQRNRFFLVGAFLVCLASRLSADAIIKKASFTKGDALFEIRMTIRQVTTGVYGPGSVKCSYSVFRNGEFLHPESLSGGTVIGCRYVAPEEVDIERFASLGWMFGVGGHCGATASSYTWTIVVPRAKTYVLKTFNSSFRPVIRTKDDRIEIWSTYQDWGGQGTESR